MRRLYSLALAILLLLPIGVVGNLYLTQDTLIYPQSINQVPHPSTQPARFQPLHITTHNNLMLRGILFPAKTVSPTLILAFAGNAHDVVGFATFLKNQVFPQPQFAVAGLAYRGYPNGLGERSDGTPTEPALKADAELLHTTLTQQLQPSKVHAIGYSLGSAVATHLAAHMQSKQQPLTTLTLIAPPASIRRLAQEQYPYLPISTLLKSPWATEDIIGNLTLPITILHTPTDGLVPPTHVKILVQNAPQSHPIAIPETRHDNILFGTTVIQHLQHAITLKPPMPSSTTPQPML